MTANTRHLSPFEIALIPDEFARAFNVRAVELIDRHHNPFAKNKILCRGSKLYWANAPRNFTLSPLIIQSLLIHELCHVWQYETGRLTAVSYLVDPRNWIYGYRVKPDADFDDYPTEKQADLLQDWYLTNCGENPTRYDRKGPPPTIAWLNKIVPFEFSR